MGWTCRKCGVLNLLRGDCKHCKRQQNEHDNLMKLENEKQEKFKVEERKIALIKMKMMAERKVLVEKERTKQRELDLRSQMEGHKQHMVRKAQEVELLKMTAESEQKTLIDRTKELEARERLLKVKNDRSEIKLRIQQEETKREEHQYQLAVEREKTEQWKTIERLANLSSDPVTRNKVILGTLKESFPTQMGSVDYTATN